jgi:hypothetical protein
MLRYSAVFTIPSSTINLIYEEDQVFEINLENAKNSLLENEVNLILLKLIKKIQTPILKEIDF